MPRQNETTAMHRLNGTTAMPRQIGTRLAAHLLRRAVVHVFGAERLRLRARETKTVPFASDYPRK
eukprot:4036020-Pleurochrysis_carterae.AAC.1